jgi:hypothetical protein
MSFRLADIKKTVRSRGDGERYVHPKLLDAAALEGQVGLALAYFHARLGRKRRDFEPELLVRFFGEPKVARGLVACLGSAYRWRAQSFADVLEPRDLVRLGLRDIHSPSSLRLHLFDAVNRDADGFLSGEPEIALLPLARRLGLSVPKLEQLFTLDAEENAVLVRVGDVPEPGLLVAHYNFQVVQALIRNCAFLEFPEITDLGRRAIIDACRLYDVELVEQLGGVRVLNRSDSFGNFARWGRRVARALYTAASVAPSLLTTGRARLAVGGKPAWYLFDRKTQSSLTAGSGVIHCALPLPELTDLLQRRRPAGGMRGRQLLAMPEPLVSAAGPAIAQYAVRSGECEILLWPVLSHVDIAAVQALHNVDVPVLALQLPACIAPLPTDIAAVDWETGLTGIMAALDQHWGGGRVDAGAQALEGLLSELESRGFIPEMQVSEALGCGSLDELPGRLRALDAEQGRFIPGLGLCSPSFAEAMRHGLRKTSRPKPAA